MKIIESLLTPNDYSRPRTKIGVIKGIVVHWVANPKTTAEANRNFFENRKEGKEGYGAAHYIINLDGSVLRCIPETELAYHVGAKQYKEETIKKLGAYPNETTIGIECTHLDWDGNMTEETYSTLLNLCIDLCKRYRLNPMSDLYLHFDITGKDCHRYFVNNQEAWKEFKNKVLKGLQIVNNEKSNNQSLKTEVDKAYEAAVETLNKAGIISETAKWINVKDPNMRALIMKMAKYIR